MNIFKILRERRRQRLRVKYDEDQRLRHELKSRIATLELEAELMALKRKDDA